MRVHLVDASPYIFRAYFSVPTTLRDHLGGPANAVHGFASFLLRLRDEERPTHLALFFDRNLSSSFRNELLPSYKQQRELPPPELEAQIDGCLRLGQALGIPVFISDRYEAEDLLAAICRALVAEGHEAVVVTSDKDLMQLVSERVSLYDLARGERYGPAEVRAKFGVDPSQITDFLGLAGDTVDNIPGVPGIGPKTAAALLQAFGTLEGIYQRIGEVPYLPLRGAAGVAAKLAEHRQSAFLSKRLAQLPAEAADEARAEFASLVLRNPEPGLAGLLDEFVFTGQRARLEGWSPLSPEGSVQKDTQSD
jgi:5'-3' exonuclease